MAKKSIVFENLNHGEINKLKGLLDTQGFDYLIYEDRIKVLIDGDCMLIKGDLLDAIIDIHGLDIFKLP